MHIYYDLCYFITLVTLKQLLIDSLFITLSCELYFILYIHLYIYLIQLFQRLKNGADCIASDQLIHNLQSKTDHSKTSIL